MSTRKVSMSSTSGIANARCSPFSMQLVSSPLVELWLDVEKQHHTAIYAAVLAVFKQRNTAELASISAPLRLTILALERKVAEWTKLKGYGPRYSEMSIELNSMQQTIMKLRTMAQWMEKGAAVHTVGALRVAPGA